MRSDNAIERSFELTSERCADLTPLVECEVSSHDAYGTPRQLFVAFFTVIAASLRDILGAEWTSEIDAAWRQLLDGIE
jgi:hypothetical protein